MGFKRFESIISSLKVSESTNWGTKLLIYFDDFFLLILSIYVLSLVYQWFYLKLLRSRVSNFFNGSFVSHYHYVSLINEIE